MKTSVYKRNGGWYVKIYQGPTQWSSMCVGSWDEAMKIASRRKGQGPLSLINEWRLKQLQYKLDTFSSEGTFG